MPELPEVETIVRELKAADLSRKKIIKAFVFWSRIVDHPSSEEFIKKIRNQEIQKIERRGKYLVFTLSHDTLLVHLRMTGKFQIKTADSPVEKHEHVRLIFENGKALSYQDPRKFGRWSLLEDATEKMDQLGLEPLSLDFTLSAFKQLIKNHKTQIKPFLLNQKYIAGLGNIYVDEALWEAKIHPKRLTSSLTDQDIKKLHQAIQNVLKTGISNSGTSLGKGKGNFYNVNGQRGGHQQYLKVFRLEGKTCPRCKDILKKIVVAQRGTHFCPTCQKLKESKDASL